MDEDKKLLAKLNRLYKKYEKDKGNIQVTEEIKEVCSQLKVDYTMYMDYMAGDPITTALIQSMTVALPIVEKIKKEAKPNGNKENRDK